MTRRALWAVLSLASLASLASCGERARTQVMLIVEADAVVRAGARSVVVDVSGRAAGDATFGAPATFSFDPADTGWPIEVAIVPQGDDASRTWRAVVRAEGGGGATIVEQRAISTWLAERTLSYTIVLRAECSGAGCSDEQTCAAGGGCTSALVPVEELAPYRPPAPSDAGSANIDAQIVADAGLDARPADATLDAPPDGGCLPAATEVDLLFMIDNSNSMAEEQTTLATDLPALVEALSSGDGDGDGVRDFVPIDSLRIGIVSSDMGTGGFMVPTCGNGTQGYDHGDDGVLLTRAPSGGACAASYPAVFEYVRGGGDPPMAFAAEVACVTSAGTGGCGFEQQLESVLKAIAPEAPTAWTAPGYAPISFFGATAGHGDGSNAGLFRAGSVLAVVLVTDEEDCSWIDPDLTNPSSATYGGTDLNLRCFTHRDAVHPTARFVDGLLQMRVDPRRLVYAAITGIPVGADPGTSAPDYADILGHPAMTEELDPSMPSRLRPSCNEPGRGLAFPPRRIVTVARDLDARGAGTTVHSICQSSYAAAIERIAVVIGERVEGTCGP